MIRKRRLGWLALAVLTLGLGGAPYRWERPIDLPPAAGWCVVDLPDDVLAAARAGLPDLRVVAGDEEIAYVLESRLRPTQDFESLHDVEIFPGHETTAILDRGPRVVPSESIEVEVAGSEPFLKPTIVEASDDRLAWREIARGSLFRADGTTMTTFRFAPNDRRYWRLRLDDRNGPPVRPQGVVVKRAVGAPPPREIALSVARAPADTKGTSVYTVMLSSEHLPIVALDLQTREAAFERRVRVYERVLFRDELLRRLVGESTISRAADGRGSSTIGVGDVSSRALEVEVDDGDSPPLDVSGVSARLQAKRILFFARAGLKASLRYGSTGASPPHYDLDSALARGRPASLREVRLGPAVDLGPSPNEVQPPARGAAVEASQWSVRRPIALPALGPVAYLDLDPADAQGARIVDADRHQVPYIFEQRERHVRRSISLQAAEHGQTTELTISGADVQRAQVLELSATAPDYFERPIVISQETFDQRGVTGRRTLGTATWRKRPGEPFAPLRIPLSPHEGPTFFVTIDNGDNSAIALGPAAVDIALRRIDFAFQPGEKFTLLTGNRSAGPAQYDLALLAPVVLAAPAAAATLGDSIAQPPATPAVPRWFWIAATVSGALLVLALLRALNPQPAGPGSGPPS